MLIILHAGAPKTGTTAIQSFFETCLEGFEASGVYYPSRLISKARGHALFSNIKKVQYGQDGAEAITAIQSHLKAIEDRGYDQLLFSFEDLFGFPFRFNNAYEGTVFFEKIETYAGKLQTAFKGHDLQIIFFTRPLEPYLLSAYSQYSQMGGTQSLEKVLALLDPATISWHRVYNRLAGSFGDAALAFYRYENFKDKPFETLLAAFTTLETGLQTGDQNTLKQVQNKALSKNTLAVIRFTNKVMQALPQSQRKRLHQALRRHFYPTLNRLLPNAPLRLQNEALSAQLALKDAEDS